ncbi:MlaE family lipid ABC transporter permease subunit [Maliponia aquimaris]|uniref:Putative phospholipid ABC transporter permease protein MlaE n=1 Tax=Maliponia aquimaris TaxID=1673631 RepID=A0A238L7L3_9RHOB|nr:MlaE family lipid ABC transporter permease subunit [Maliponia aquimaris]SMX50296.1 putative phospholipid ABC transporter permease protein MlaE [Maliponia aquimaris]
MQNAGLQVETEITPEGALVRLAGPLTIRTVTALRDQLSALDQVPNLTVEIDPQSQVDTAGAWALSVLEQRITAAGGAVVVHTSREDLRLLLDTVRRAMPTPETPASPERGLVAFLERSGRTVVHGVAFLGDLTGYFGLFLMRMLRFLRHPGEFRMTAFVAHCDDVGLRAVPIVSLMAFLIGVVLAFQGSAQLRQFGAEVFVVDLIAISVLRELGILLTAIIVAGRTASSFTAAIGSMKMREEIDAMRTLGLDPAVVLFVPRILALLVTLPILGLIANVTGLLGGAIMSWIELGISPSMFRTRLIEGTDVSHVFVGLVKAPVFALIIGVVGCQAGMQVKGNAESLGRMTSNAVVTAIFAVIVADALFSIFFAQVGL